MRPSDAAQNQLETANERSVDDEAQIAFMKGRYHLARRSSEDLARAIDQLSRAVACDATIPAAHASLACAHALVAVTSYDQPAREHFALEAARVSAQRAVTLDISLGDAHAALAEVSMRQDREWADAEKRFTKAIELDPHNAVARQGYSLFLQAQRRGGEAEVERRRAAALEPAAVALMTLDFSSPTIAIAAADRLCVASGRRPYALAVLGFACGRDRQRDAAREIIAELTERHRKREASGWVIAYPFIGLGEHDHAFEWLSIGAREGGALPAFVDVEPLLGAMRGESRFLVLRSQVTPAA